jgi:hypothetical protein
VTGWSARGANKSRQDLVCSFAGIRLATRLFSVACWRRIARGRSRCAVLPGHRSTDEEDRVSRKCCRKKHVIPRTPRKRCYPSERGVENAYPRERGRRKTPLSRKRLKGVRPELGRQVVRHSRPASARAGCGGNP